MAEFGLAALWLAAALAGLQLFTGVSSLRGGQALAGLTRPVAVLQGGLTAISFSALVMLFSVTARRTSNMAATSPTAAGRT